MPAHKIIVTGLHDSRTVNMMVIKYTTIWINATLNNSLRDIREIVTKTIYVNGNAPAAASTAVMRRLVP